MSNTRQQDPESLHSLTLRPSTPDILVSETVMCYSRLRVVVLDRQQEPESLRILALRPSMPTILVSETVMSSSFVTTGLANKKGKKFALYIAKHFFVSGINL